MQVEILSMFKLVSFESLARNDVSEWGSQAEAHCKRNLNPSCEVLDITFWNPCSRNFCRHYYKS